MYTCPQLPKTQDMHVFIVCIHNLVPSNSVMKSKVISCMCTVSFLILLCLPIFNQLAACMIYRSHQVLCYSVHYMRQLCEGLPSVSHWLLTQITQKRLARLSTNRTWDHYRKGNYHSMSANRTLKLLNNIWPPPIHQYINNCECSCISIVSIGCIGVDVHSNVHPQDHLWRWCCCTFTSNPVSLVNHVDNNHTIV